MNRPSKLAALLASVALSVLFLVVFGTINRVAAQLPHIETWYYEWERIIPFVPIFIIPYMSIDLFYVAAPFLCRSRSELKTLCWRIVCAIMIAGFFFLVLPLRLAVIRPVPTDWTAPIFQFLHAFDKPVNLFPSLHIILRTILADHYARHTKGAVRIASHVWFSLIGFSTLLTYQHHFVDIVGGFVVAAFCFYIIPDAQERTQVSPNRRVGFYYAAGALLSAGAAFLAWPWTAILLWPAGAMAITAAGYWRFGPAIYRKTNGQLPLSTKLILGPCLLGQWLSLWYYRRKCAAWNEVAPGLWIGSKLNSREALEARRRGVTAVLDLTGEFSADPSLLQLDYLNLPVLDLTRPSSTQMRAAADFISSRAKRGTVLVHCKIGYSRSAAAVGAYLLTSNQSATVETVVAQIRHARPTVVIRQEARAALEAFHAELRA